MVTFDPKSAQSPSVNPPSDPQGSPGFASPIPDDMRFANDHNTLAPHQLPKLPSEQEVPSIKPDLFTHTLPKAPTPAIEPTSPVTPASPQAGQQITLTINPNSSQPSIKTTPISPAAPQPMVQINVQAGNSTADANTPKIDNSNSEVKTKTVIEVPANARIPRKVEFFRWFVIFGLAGIGMKGFFDSLYFIFVEFQNFEKALEDHLIETAMVQPLILKASLLVFATALCIFFGMQLTMTKAKHLRFFRIFGSIIVGVACAAVINYAGTINVLDSFKSP